MMTAAAPVARVALATGLSLAMAAPQNPFRATTTAIVVEVAVRDRRGPVRGLTAEAFRVHDNDRRQTIQAVSVETVSRDVTLIVDTRDVAPDLLTHIRAALDKSSHLIRPGDRLRIFVFDGVLVDLAGWREAGHRWNLERVRSSEEAAVQDALVLAMVHQGSGSRRHLVVAITDGRDGDSVLTTAAVWDVAHRSDVTLHLIRVPVRPARTSAHRYLFYPVRIEREDEAWERLTDAAVSTGGSVRRSSNGRDILRAFQDVYDESRDSYVLSYTPDGPVEPGWHRIAVAVPGPSGVAVRARRGYYAIRH